MTKKCQTQIHFESQGVSATHDDQGTRYGGDNRMLLQLIALAPHFFESLLTSKPSFLDERRIKLHWSICNENLSNPEGFERDKQGMSVERG